MFDNDQEEVQRGIDLCRVQGVVFGEQPFAGAAPRDVTLLNRHRRTIQQAFLQPAEQRDWGEDVLGTAVLAVGDRMTVRAESGCRADLRIVFDSNAAEERRDIDICAATVIALRPGWTVADRLDAADAGDKQDPPSLAVRLRNAAGLPIIAVHADPIGAAARGPNRLGASVLGAGESRALSWPAPTGAAAGEPCRADLVAVYSDGIEQRIPGVDLCGGAEVEMN